MSVPKAVKKKSKFVTKGATKKGQLSGYSTSYVPKGKVDMIPEEEEKEQTIMPGKLSDIVRHNIPATQEFMEEVVDARQNGMDGFNELEE